jgi:hypothetical protein
MISATARFAFKPKLAEGYDTIKVSLSSTGSCFLFLGHSRRRKGCSAAHM